MILSNKDIKRILVENPTRSLWDRANTDRKRLQMHVLGDGLESYIEKIDIYETLRGSKLRKKYCKTNRDLFARLLRPIDNIFSGRGGGTFFNTSDSNSKAIRQDILNVINGYSSRKWVDNFWRPRYIDDPGGIVFMEVSNDAAYPVYWSSADIYDALPAGRSLEYIIFKTADPEIFRVVDDAYDLTVKKTGDGDSVSITVLNSKEYPRYVNWFDKVPAIIISDIPRNGIDGAFQSPIQDEVELADIFIREGSIATIYRLKQGFPKTWRYPEVCGTCKGQKVVGAQPCNDCNGSGIKLLSEPSDVSVFSWPSKDEPEIREKGGFIAPDLDYLKYADESLKLLEETITRTHWGTERQKDKTGAETATGRFIDVQPVINRLTRYAEAAEKIEEFIIDHIGIFKFKSSWKGCGVSLGRRFLIEGPDEIWTKYQAARKDGAPLATLDGLLRDYYETKFIGNNSELQKSLVLAAVEPGVHLTMKEAKDVLPYSEYIKKVYFQDFVTTITDIQVITTPIADLKAKLTEYAKTRISEEIVNPNAPDPGAAGGPAPAGQGKGDPIKVPAGSTV